MTNRKFFNIKTMAKVSILAAIAFILMEFDFPIPFIAPPFYKLDFSEVAVLIGGFAMGPLAGVAIEAMKVFLSCLFFGSGTAYVGELANFVMGCAFILPAAWLYRRHKNLKSALIGMILGTVSLMLVGGLTNYFVMVPAYSFFFNMPLEAMISMGAKVVPFVDNAFTLVLFCTTPFNLIKGIVTSLMVFLLYKHISPILHR